MIVRTPVNIQNPSSFLSLLSFTIYTIFLRTNANWHTISHLNRVGTFSPSVSTPASTFNSEIRRECRSHRQKTFKNEYNPENWKNEDESLIRCSGGKKHTIPKRSFALFSSDSQKMPCFHYLTSKKGGSEGLQWFYKIHRSRDWYNETLWSLYRLFISFSRYWLISAKLASSLLLFRQYLDNETFSYETVLDLASAYSGWLSIKVASNNSNVDDHCIRHHFRLSV